MESDGSVLEAGEIFDLGEKQPGSPNKAMGNRCDQAQSHEDKFQSRITLSFGA